MDKSLFIAMTGAKQNMMAQQINANNLANANTTGFKRDYAVAQSMAVYGQHYPSRVYAITESPGTDLNAGPLIKTGRDLDVAVKGSGWIAVQAQDGTEAYTRAGDLQIDANGILRTGSGLPVLGNGGPVAVPPADKVQIGTDGTISVVPKGGPANQLAQVDRIKLVNPPEDQLRKGVDGLMRMKSVNGQTPTAPADASVTLAPGFLEGSNVNPVESLVSTLQLARQYELQVHAMRTTDQDAQSAARILQNL